MGLMTTLTMNRRKTKCLCSKSSVRSHGMCTEGFLTNADRVFFPQNTRDQNYFILKIGGRGYFHTRDETAWGRDWSLNIKFHYVFYKHCLHSSDILQNTFNVPAFFTVIAWNQVRNFPAVITCLGSKSFNFGCFSDLGFLRQRHWTCVIITARP